MSRTPPAYLRYRQDFARVKIGGKLIHLGRYDSEESWQKYRRLIAQWSASQGRVELPAEPEGRSVAEVLAAFLRHAGAFYGEQSKRYDNLRRIVREVRLLYADLPAVDFSPKKLKIVRQRFVDRGTSCGNTPKAGRRQAALDRVGDHYDAGSYRKAVHRACDRASVARWSPNRLRHTAGTIARERFGLDGAQALLGHSHARVTEVYGELRTEQALMIAREIG